MTVEESGHCMARDYWSLPDGCRAELIDVRLYDIATPNRLHQVLVLGIACVLKGHAEAGGVPCGVYTAPFAVNLFGDETSFVEPDVCAVCDPGKLSERGCEGAPEFVAEVASSSSCRMNYLGKMALYERAA